uniref:Pentatricopeptide repeat-containing protein, chloroplastic n=1 Tax=Alexandrium monilatum TaxID=311494 RepID=A0A6T0XLZ7_9DINO
MRHLGLQPDVVALNGAIAANAKGEHWHSALGLLVAASASRLRHTLVTCSAALGSCAAAACWLQALGLLEDVSCGGISSDPVARCAAISASGRARRWGQAWILLSAVWPSELRPLVAACREALADGTGAAFAAALLRELAAGGVRPGELVAIQRVLSRGRRADWQGALDALSCMWVAGLKPDARAVCNVAVACRRDARWREAVGALAAARARGLELGVQAFVAAAASCEGARGWCVALAVQEGMRLSSLQIDAVACTSVASTLEKAWRWQAGSDFVQRSMGGTRGGQAVGERHQASRGRAARGRGTDGAGEELRDELLRLGALLDSGRPDLRGGAGPVARARRGQWRRPAGGLCRRRPVASRVGLPPRPRAERPAFRDRSDQRSPHCVREGAA